MSPHRDHICRYCGCTDFHACVLADGDPCHWYAPGVCSNPKCIRAFKAGKP
jgi:hypothetical protein